MTNESTDLNLHHEIFQTPSQELRSDRFTDTAEAAVCRAKCTGDCASVTD